MDFDVFCNIYLFIYSILRGYLFFISSSTNFIKIFIRFWESMPIDCMAIGGLFALIVYEKTSIVNKLRNILFNKITQWIILLTTIYLISIGFKMKELHYEFYSILFGILIINFACNKDRIFSMENKVFNYLGKISYGLYMFHPIVVVFSIKLCEILNFKSNYFLYPMVFILIIILASLSYEFFEKIFINKKIKYSDIISGDNTKI